ncbi:hypothetical protein IAE49_01190 [Kosakonia sp. S58]|uniref:hypothetical protein n=1 Tax=unclassified Kosakonia TaxID=2632876 RepID=UPI001907E3E5|nr:MULTISPECIES: hypothetical protein [unclassified Kosakonia]MBK0077878.1 hypothetical protein [Kosakonia sp. S57]MBK0084856.1 hypothetical protein [Kosakonia sp. S58]
MKKLLIGVLLTLSTGCTTTHSFMDKAYVGYVNNKAVVLFDAGTRNGVKYYRPQFQSDCGRIYNKSYQDDNSSTGCLIRDTRIAELHPYREHVSKVMLHQTDRVHDWLEGVNSPSYIPDNL